MRQREPSRQVAAQEYMIGLLAGLPNSLSAKQQPLRDIVDSSEYFYDFLLGVTGTDAVAANTDRRVWYLDRDSPDPGEVIIDVGSLIAA